MWCHRNVAILKKIFFQTHLYTRNVQHWGGGEAYVRMILNRDGGQNLEDRVINPLQEEIVGFSWNSYSRLHGTDAAIAFKGA